MSLAGPGHSRRNRDRTGSQHHGRQQHIQGKRSPIISSSFRIRIRLKVPPFLTTDLRENLQIIVVFLCFPAQNPPSRRYCRRTALPAATPRRLRMPRADNRGSPPKSEPIGKAPHRPETAPRKALSGTQRKAPPHPQEAAGGGQRQLKATLCRAPCSSITVQPVRAGSGTDGYLVFEGRRADIIVVDMPV